MSGKLVRECEVGKLFVFDDVVLFEYAEVTIDLAVAQQACVERELVFAELGAGKHPYVVDIRNIKGTTKGARDLLATAHENRHVEAGALVIGNAFTSMIGNFFLRISKPPVPSRLFDSVEGAINWLRDYRPT